MIFADNLEIICGISSEKPILWMLIRIGSPNKAIEMSTHNITVGFYEDLT